MKSAKRTQQIWRNDVTGEVRSGLVREIVVVYAMSLRWQISNCCVVKLKFDFLFLREEKTYSSVYHHYIFLNQSNNCLNCMVLDVCQVCPDRQKNHMRSGRKTILFANFSKIKINQPKFKIWIVNSWFYCTCCTTSWFHSFETYCRILWCVVHDIIWELLLFLQPFCCCHHGKLHSKYLIQLLTSTT